MKNNKDAATWRGGGGPLERILPSNSMMDWLPNGILGRMEILGMDVQG